VDRSHNMMDRFLHTLIGDSLNHLQFDYAISLLFPLYSNLLTGLATDSIDVCRDNGRV